MASTYRKGNKIYISWYDSVESKALNRSTGLNYSVENMKKAKAMAKKLDNKLAEAKEEFRMLGIRRDTIQAAMEHFLKNNSDKNKNTIYEYNWFFKRFNMKFKPHELCTSITKLECESWIISLRDLNYAQNSLQSYVKILKKFLTFLAEYSYIPLFRINKDVIIQPEVKRIIVFSEANIITMLEGLANKSGRFQIAFQLLLYTGLRPSDLIDLKYEDINLTKQNFQYYSPKTKEYLQVPIHNDLVPILAKNLESRGDGKILDYKDVKILGRAFHRYLNQLELDGKGYNLRTFRKTFVTLAHDSGLDLATVSKLVGHKKISTTQKYYNLLSISKQTDELEKLKMPSIPDKLK
jgi:integrase